MSPGTTVVLYLLIGVGVAVAVAARGGRSHGELVFRALVALPFWPLFVPLLLSGSDTASAAETGAKASPQDELSAAIAQADTELEAALGSLDGWAEHALSRERGRIEELRTAWKAQAERVREMDRLLSRPDAELLSSPAGEATPAAERLRQIEEARRQNRERLRQLRAQAYNDLLGNLARVRELASLIHLAKFSGAPAARAEELVASIAAAVEGVSGLTWQANRKNQQFTAGSPH
jgi:hypothetical protein